MAIGKGQIAADVHRRMVEDERFGYSWEERWGSKDEKWTVDGVSFTMSVGDYDCSSSSITAWKKALTGTKYARVLDGASYTGNMREVFVRSGLFEWKPISFIASPGDLYLSESNHVAVCQRQVPDELSEFSWGDNGAYGNRRGDQSGFESRVNPYYDYEPDGWDGILHYNGKADEKSTSSKGSTSHNTAEKRLYGIDVSSNQPERVVSMVPNDFAIVKMSGNPPEDWQGRKLSWNFVNPFAKQQAADAVKKHGLLGFYHFTYGIQAATEAEFFVEQVRKLGYLGKAMLVIDYEDAALSRGQTWVNAFAKKVEQLAGYKPVIYAQGSAVTGQNLFSLGYPVWCANYSRGYQPIYGYDTSGCTIWRGCEKSAMWQYTSEGYLNGYGDALDCNVFFGTADDFRALMGPKAHSHRYRIVKAVYARTQRKMGRKYIVGQLKKGETVELSMVKKADDGITWAHICDGKFEGNVLAVDFRGDVRAKRM
jgi:hypothetical protein